MRSRHMRVGRLAIIAVALITLAAQDAGAVLLSSQRATLEQSQKVGQDTIETLDTEGWVAVIVAYDLPGALVSPKSALFDDEARRTWNAAIKLEGDRIAAKLTGSGAVIKEQYRSARAFSAVLPVGAVLELASDSSVLRIDEERSMRATLTQAVPFAGLDRTQALGFTGAGTTVAILDTGFERTHPDISDDLVEEQCFCTRYGQPCCPNGTSRQSGPGSAPEDNFVHGTYTAGIITGRGTIAPRGAAPDASIIGIKVMGRDGVGGDAGIIDALDWILNERSDVDVVNMSFGQLVDVYNGPCDDFDAATRAKADIIDALRSRGTTVVASTGNDHLIGAMEDPACIQSVISVAASYDNDPANANFPDCPSDSRAPDTVSCIGNVNHTTDLVAPGVNITATYTGGGIGIGSGTSAAAALVSGCSALLAEATSHLPSRQIEEALENAPEIVDEGTIPLYPPGGLRFPRLDCMDAMNQLLAGTGLCPATARPNCRGAGSASLGPVYLRKNVTDASKDVFRWSWLRGTATNATDFGAPDAITSFSVCAYDQSGARRVLNLFVPAGGSCAGKPCWRPYFYSGWRYTDKLASPSGITALTLTPGATGYASIKLKGSAANLQAPTPPFQPPVRVQMINHLNNVCWEARYNSPSANGGTGSYRYFKDTGE